LHAVGRRAADRWLAENHEAVCIRSTLDLSGLIPSKDGLFSVPSIIKQKYLSTWRRPARSYQTEGWPGSSEIAIRKKDDESAIGQMGALIRKARGRASVPAPQLRNFSDSL